jgi:hypothetical protein
MLSDKLKCVLEMILGDEEEEDCDNCDEKKDDEYREKASRMKLYGSSNRKMWMPR